MKTLTVLGISSLKPKEQEYKQTVERGLQIRVATNGTKTWLVRYVVNGKQKQITLPKPFGTTGQEFMSLYDAKILNAKIQALAKDGIDYQIQQLEAEKKKQTDEADQLEAFKAEQEQNLTFQDVFNAWTQNGVSRVDGNQMLIRTFNNHAMPTLGTIPLRELSENHLLTTLRGIFEQGKNRTAIMLHDDIRQMLRWAEKRKPYRGLMVDGNPAELVDIELLIPRDYEEARDRVLSINEIRQLQRIFGESERAYQEAPNKYQVERPVKKETQIAIWISLSTLCRIGELLMTEWRHVDFEARTWQIPKENTKGTRRNQHAHTVYLSDFTLSKFRELFTITGDGQYAFPAKNNSIHGGGHVCVKSVSKQIGDRQTRFKHRNTELKNRANNNTLVLGEQDWTPHDLRRTGATMMQGDLKIPLDVIDRCQNHVLAGSKVRRHYMHHEYENEKREAWEKLGARLAEILDTSAANI